MPCVFCIAMVMAGAGAITATAIELMQAKLGRKAATPVQKVSDTSSVARLEFSMQLGKKNVPVALSVFKEHRRVRIQVLTHDVSRSDAEKIENQIADLLDLKIVDRSTAADEAKVREAFDQAREARFMEGLPARPEGPPLPETRG